MPQRYLTPHVKVKLKSIGLKKVPQDKPSVHCGILWFGWK